jgi:hypothetical protein
MIQFQFVRDRNPGAFAVRVQCLTCGKLVQLSEALIDPDGPAFQAYYHDRPECRPQEEAK